MSFYEEFISHSPPCPFCVLQRFFMAAVAVPLLFNIQGGQIKKNFVVSLFACILGAIVALYQWSQLLINDGVSYAPKFLTLPIYIWSAFVFFGSALVIMSLLFFLKPDHLFQKGYFAKIAYSLMFMILIAEIGATFYTCGLFLCYGG